MSRRADAPDQPADAEQIETETMARPADDLETVLALALEAGASRTELETAVEHALGTLPLEAAATAEDLVDDIQRRDGVTVDAIDRATTDQSLRLDIALTIEPPTGEDAYPCPDCEDAFATRRGRSVHQNRVHDRTEANDAELDHSDTDDLRRAYEEEESFVDAATRFAVGPDAIRSRLIDAGIHEPATYADQKDDVDDPAGQEDADQEDAIDIDADETPHADATALVNSGDVSMLSGLADELGLSMGSARAVAMDAGVYSRLADDGVERPGTEAAE